MASPILGRPANPSRSRIDRSRRRGHDEPYLLAEVNEAFNEDADLPGHWEANARLIAAAPEQNEAHKVIAELMQGNLEPAKEFAKEHGIELPRNSMELMLHMRPMLVDRYPARCKLAQRISEYALDKATGETHPNE